MNKLSFNRAVHFSIVWGITLAVVTLVEWNSLDRDPVRQEIMTPFIERNIAVSVEEPVADVPGTMTSSESPDAVLRYEVELKFNGPLFLACFFIPMLIFHAVGMLWNRVRSMD